MIYSLGFVCAATARELSWRSWAASRPVCLSAEQAEALARAVRRLSVALCGARTAVA